MVSLSRVGEENGQVFTIEIGEDGVIVLNGEEIEELLEAKAYSKGVE